MSAARKGPGGAPPDAAAFRCTVRVYYEDTDAGGVVYYANYLRFFERCRTEWMRALGFGQHELAQREGVIFVVAAAQMQYLRPARLDDEIVIEARIAQRGASFAVFEQQALRGDERLAHGQVKVACVDAATLRPTRLPPSVARALEAVAGGKAGCGDAADVTTAR